MDFNQIYAVVDDSSKGNPADWAQRYLSHPAYQQYVVQPLQQKNYQIPQQGQVGTSLPQVGVSRRAAAKPAIQSKSPIQNILTSARQFLILSARNLRILSRDRISLALMLASAPLIASIDFITAGGTGKSLFDYTDGKFDSVLRTLFFLAINAVMVGAFSQMREFVKEDDIYKRERLINLKIFPYVLSKVWVAGLLALYQGAAFTIIHYLAFNMPGGATEFIFTSISMTLYASPGRC